MSQRRPATGSASPLPHPIRTLLVSAADYPAALRRRLGERAPSLYLAGRLFARAGVAVVGTRAASSGGARAAEELAGALVGAGFDVISGGALGIDAAAHRGAVEAVGEGATVAILGCGPDVAYPARNRRLFGDLVAAGGALVAPFSPGTPPRRWHFPTRNALIAAWAEAVVVVEAGFRSGALNTARHARELGVPVLARPGSPGTQALIGRRARPVSSAADVLAALHGGSAEPRPGPEEPDERAVLAALERRQAEAGATVAELANEAGLSLPRAAAALIRLQLAGRARPTAGGRYLAML